MNILIIGGTRNVGHLLVYALAEAGHTVCVLNRGLTRDQLPEAVERLRADRTEPNQLRTALQGRSFDAVIDTTLYNESEAKAVVELLRGRTGHYIFLSSGQVYLVREAIARPFKESDYAGRIMPPPKPDTFAYWEWSYGVNKRAAEDVLTQHMSANGFPLTTLRLPMVNGERDHFYRLYNYVLRIGDGGPILVPTTPNHPLRHVFANDVVTAILRALANPTSIGRVYNISQDETVSLDAFLGMVGEVMSIQPKIVRMRREVLEEHDFLPDCSPFSERWMSELDNQLSKAELGMTYTPLTVYLRQIVTYYLREMPPKPRGYRRRKAEILLPQLQPEADI
jgi:nucleoside-diphosphate-sugar epimerase